MIIDAAGYTNVGLVRSTNQDSILIRAEKNYGFFVVADGMGGHSGGDIASQAIIKALAQWWDGGALRRATGLKNLAFECESEIKKVSNFIFEDFKSKDMVGGSTVVALIVVDKHVVILNAGDSHIYKVHEDVMYPLMIDDVWENQPSIRESMGDEDIMVDERFGKLTSAVGAMPEINVTIRIYEQDEEEFFMLCSDGVYKYCGADKLRGTYVAKMKSLPATDTIQMFAKHVLSNGANDNFTIAICHTKLEE